MAEITISPVIADFLDSQTESQAREAIGVLSRPTSTITVSSVIADFMDSQTELEARNAIGVTAGTGTVSSVSVTTANGVSGTVANATTTPAITLTLGAITPTTVNGMTFASVLGSISLASTGASLAVTAGSAISISGSGTLNIGSIGTVTSVVGGSYNGVTITFDGSTTTPTISAINLGAIAPTSVNVGTGGDTIQLGASPGLIYGKELQLGAGNSITDTGTGGALGTAAFTDSSAYSPVAGSSSIATTGTVTSGTWSSAITNATSLSVTGTSTLTGAVSAGSGAWVRGAITCRGELYVLGANLILFGDENTAFGPTSATNSGLAFYSGAGSEKMRIHASGGVSIGNTTDPGATNLSVTGTSTLTGGLILPTSTTPASASATGVAGTVCRDSDYIYVCVSTNSWKRVAISVW